MHGAEFGSAVSPIMTMPHFALILEITPLNPFPMFSTMSILMNLLKIVQKVVDFCR